MFDLYGCYFMYGDFNSEEYDLVFGNMDTSRLVALESPKNINTVKSRKHNVYYVNRVSYVEEPISFEAEIFTNDTMPIMVDDLPIIERALFNRHSYTKLYQIMPYERDPVYINCILTNPERIENMSGVVGYKFTVNTDSVMAWEETNTQEVNEESTSTTITGDIVSFTDTKEYALKQAIVDIDCVQDLHGYDHPWAGGTGKNKAELVDPQLTTNVAQRVATLNYTGTFDITISFDLVGAKYTASGAALFNLYNGTANYAVPTSIYKIDNSTTIQLNTEYTGRFYYKWTNVENPEYINMYFESTSYSKWSGQMKNIQVEIGTRTDYEPYENICPISGWTGCEVNVTGVNIWDEEWEAGGISTTTGQNSGNTNSIRSKNYIRVLPSTDYYLKCGNPETYVWFYGKNKEFLSFSTSTPNSVFTTPSNCHYIRIRSGGSSHPATTYNHDISINYPSTDHDYHAYNGTTYSVTWQSEAGTVYGGTLDVTTGLLTVTHRFIEVSECASVSTASTDVKYAQISFGTGNGADADHSTNVSSKYIQVESAPETDGYYRIVSSYLYIYDNRFTDQTTANSILSAEKPQFVYKLANPQTYQLDPRQVYTIVGNNNIWSDTGNITISYNQTNDFHIDVDTDLDDYIYPDVEIQVGGEGGDIVIYNATDDATRFTEFSSVPPFTTFTMQGSINHITNGMYNHFTSRNFIRLLNGRNNFFMYGDIERITFRFNNRKYM